MYFPMAKAGIIITFRNHATTALYCCRSFLNNICLNADAMLIKCKS